MTGRPAPLKSFTFLVIRTVAPLFFATKYRYSFFAKIAFCLTKP